MGIEHLDRMFSPKSIAVIGASGKAGRAGRVIVENLRAGGFAGEIALVNPGYDSLMGLPVVPRVDDLERVPDLALVAVPMDQVVDVTRACADRGVGGCLIISASRPDPLRGEKCRALAHLARTSGMRILGPDSVGLVSSHDRLNAGILFQPPRAGKIAFIFQSGAVATSVLDLALARDVGVSHLVSLGSELDVDVPDMLDYLGSLPRVESILMCVESLGPMRKFMSAARAVSRVKPIIAMKSGRTRKRVQGSEDELVDAAFQRAGILRVHDIQDLFDCAAFLARQPRPRGPRLAIVSNARGVGTLAADALGRHDLSPARLDRSTVQALDRVTGDQGWNRSHPIELDRATRPQTFVKVVEICIQASEIDGLLILSSPLGTQDCTAIARPLVELMTATPFPVFTAWLGGKNVKGAREIFNTRGIVSYGTPEQAVKAFVNLHRYGRNLSLLQEIPYTTDKRFPIDRDRAGACIDGALNRGGTQRAVELSRGEARELLHAYGIPLGKETRGEGADFEVEISAVNTPHFGPVIRFGLGGIYTHVIQDRAVALPPLNRLLARRAIHATRISQLLKGYGRVRAVDLVLLEEYLILVSRLITDYPQLVRLRLNPIRVSRGRLIPTSVRITLVPSDQPPSSQLIISAYPWWQESTWSDPQGTAYFFRPIRPGDAGPALDLFKTLSRETILRRFFSPLKEIPRSLLVRLTQIDYDREVALCAFVGPAGKRQLVGVARIVFFTRDRIGEFAIVVSDHFQGKGLGKVLLTRALAAARKLGLERVVGPVMHTNEAMIHMGQGLGFSLDRDPDSGEYCLSLALS
ncbi:MAG: GNAT family N-acetyltransferase [Desulfobacterales bacterium]|nr:GNAT family N-acetyltransferase [Desulfobacterales bacterium]